MSPSRTGILRLRAELQGDLLRQRLDCEPMAISTLHGVATDSTLVRVSYFTRGAAHAVTPSLQEVQHGGEVSALELRHVAAGMAQLDAILRSIRETWLSRVFGEGHGVAPAGQRIERASSEVRYTLRDVSLGSLKVVLEIPPTALPVLGLALILVAERICTFGPRVSAKRQGYLRAAAEARLERENLELEDAVRHAVLAAKAHDLRRPAGLSEQGPDYVDLLDAAEAEDDLRPWDVS